MMWVVVLSLQLLKSAEGQSPSVSVIPQTGSYPIQGESLILDCYQSPDCLYPLQWYYWNTSVVENAIWAAGATTSLAASKGVLGSCSNLYNNCSLTMVADKEQDDGTWYCVCLGLNASIVVDINVLVTEIQTVPPNSWFVTGGILTNLTCYTNCVYPAANFTWTSNQTIVQGNIKSWDSPCSGEPDLLSSYSQYTVHGPNTGDYWFNCTAKNVPGWGGVSRQFIVSGTGTNRSLTVWEIVGIVFLCVAILAMGSGIAVWILICKVTTDIVFVFIIAPGKEIGVAVKAKCIGPTETTMKPGNVKITRPDGVQSEALVLEGCLPDGRKDGIVVVDGTWSDGKKGTAVVVKTASTQANEKVDASPPTNGSKLMVIGAQSDGKSVNALVVGVAWPNGVKGNAVVIKENE